jgi:hypothetical protein
LDTWLTAAPVRRKASATSSPGVGIGQHIDIEAEVAQRGSHIDGIVDRIDQVVMPLYWLLPITRAWRGPLWPKQGRAAGKRIARTTALHPVHLAQAGLGQFLFLDHRGSLDWV